MAEIRDNAAYCMDMVRAADPDRYLSVLYAPSEARAALFALYAFNVEIARIRDSVKEPLPGEIRLQWWRDTLRAEGEGAAQGSPVAAELLDAIERCRLPVEPFERMCEARIFDLYDDPMPDRTSLEGYCGETASALIQLAALVLDPDAAPPAADASGHAGVAQAIGGLLRLIPIHRRRGQLYVPADILAASGTNDAEFLAGADNAAARRAVAAMIALAREHYSRYLDAGHTLPSSLRPAFLPARLTPAYLDRLERRGFDPLDEIVTISPLRRQWLVLRAMM